MKQFKGHRYTVADPAAESGGGWCKNMKSLRRPSAAICMIYCSRACELEGWGWGYWGMTSLPSLGYAAVTIVQLKP